MSLNVVIPRSPASYEIEFCRGCRTDAAVLSKHLPVAGRKVAIITDDLVAPLYGEPICQLLRPLCAEVILLSFPHGETSKTRATKEDLENQLFERGFGRDSVIIAVGGGVVTDVAGFVAATYCRGVSLFMLPTTLLAMVDASIGGKNGVNVPWGKNLVGSIYQPQKVVIDSSTLASLPAREVRNGIVEMVKIALVSDKGYFEYLEQHASEITSFNLPILEKAIFDGCRSKKEIIERDETEQRERHLLNLGHTIGHALEVLTDHALSHGEAVAIGILVETFMAVRLGFSQNSLLERILNLFRQYGVPLDVPARFSPTQVREMMRLDKKSLLLRPRFVLLEAIGKPRLFGSSFLSEVDDSVVNEAIEWMNHALYRH